MRISTGAWWKLIGVAVVCMSLMNALAPTIGRIEGQRHPVVIGTEILRVDDDGLNSTFEGRAKKVRDCDFVEIHWYLGAKRGARSEVQITFLEREKLRLPSEFSFGPWRVRLDEDSLRRLSYADVTHDCGGLFPVITRFYPSPFPYAWGPK